MSSLVADWERFQDAQTGHVHEAIASVCQLFDTLALELDRDRAHYAAGQWITMTVLHYPTGGVLPALPPGALMPL